MDKFNQARQLLMAALKAGASNLHDETNVGDIYNINKLGMLTTDSQQGNIEYGQVPTNRALHAKIYKKLWQQYYDDETLGYDEKELLARVAKQYSAQGGSFKKGIVLKERAYLLGFLPVKEAYWLVQYLNQLDNIVAWTTVVVDGEEQPFSQTWVTYSPTTQDGEYSKNDSYPMVGMTNVNTIRYRFSESEYGEEVGASPENDKLFSHISIMDARFGRSASEPDIGLFAIVKDVLQTRN